jgi:hypothetical protein
MTTQAKDLLFFNNQVFQIAAQPLEPYLSEAEAKPGFVIPSTACWRGYCCSWELKNDRLFLVALNAYLKNDQQAGIEILFPGQKEVFAEWFSGKIRIPDGKNQDFHCNLMSDDYSILDFRRGILLNK